MSVLAGLAVPAVRSYAYWVAQYRRTWRGTIISSVVGPVLYLAAMGVGLGTLVRGGRGIEGVSYLQYVAPGLLAATAMQTAASESTYAVLGSFKWMRTYHAMAATPLTPAAVLAGHLMWMATRVATTVAVYLVVVAAFGALVSPWAVLAWPVCILTGMAFAAPITAFAASRDRDSGFAALNRFVVIPMFLFSGTFYPVSQLPDVLRYVAYATPLWHGVSLTRALALGHASSWPAAGHVAYLLVWVAAGSLVALRLFRRRLGR